MSHSAEDGPHCSACTDAGTGSPAKTLDAALLNGHLEWLLQVGFSADMILEWAREKQMDNVDDPIPDSEPQSQDSHLNSFHDIDDPIPIPDTEPESQDSQLNSFHDNSYDNDEGQSQSQESESQFSLSIHTQESSSEGTRRLAVGHVRKRKSKESSHELSAPRAKKQRLTEESLFRGTTTNRQKKVRMRNLMLEILSKLEKLPEAANFINFDTADDYDDFVDYPMSIGEIKNRIGISRCECDSRKQFCEEFDAIIEGCQKYYNDDPVRIEQARRLKAKFDELVEKYLPDDSHLQPLEEGIPLDDGSDEDEAQKGYGSSSSSDSEEDARNNSEEMEGNSYTNGDDTFIY